MFQISIKKFFFFNCLVYLFILKPKFCSSYAFFFEFYTWIIWYIIFYFWIIDSFVFLKNYEEDSIWWYIVVGPNNLWPCPIFTLGPKARAKEGYSQGWVIKVQTVLRHNRGWFCHWHIRGPPGRKGKNSIRTVWEKI